MNATLRSEVKDKDGRTIVTTRAVVLTEYMYVKRPPEEIVDAKDMLATFNTQIGEEAGHEVERLIKEHDFTLLEAMEAVCIKE